MTGRHSVVLEQPVVTAPAVAVRIADFLVRTEVERLRLFRMHLQATVRSASPLLLDLAAHMGVALADASAMIHPPQDWPWRPLDDFPPALRRKFHFRKSWHGGAPASEARAFERTFAKPGVVIRGIDHPAGPFAIRPTASVLGFAAAIGPCLLSAFGSLAMLKLPEMLPETLVTAMPGRPLSQLVDHPVFAGRRYRVVRVEPDLGDGLPVLSFRAPLVPFAMPWMTRTARTSRDCS